MMKAKIFANYGVLAHEYTCVYTETPAATATLSEPVNVEIPDEYQPYETATGEIALVFPDGLLPYMLGDVLTTGKNDTPALRWVTGSGYHYCALKIVE